MLKANNNENGINAKYFVKGNNEPVLSRNEKNIDFMWEMKSPDSSIQVDQFREARFDTYIHPTVDGKYTLKFIIGGGSCVVYDDEWGGAPIAIIDSNRDGGISTANIDITKGNTFHLCMI